MVRYLPDNQLRLGWLRVDQYHKAGYLGQGMTFLVVDADTDLSVVRYPKKVKPFKNSGDADWRINYGYHGLMTIDILQQIAPEAEILFAGKQYPLSDAVRWGISNRADIATVSMSYSSAPITEVFSQQAIDSGMLLLTSAGNEGDLPQDLKGYPGKMKTWVAVGAAFVHQDGTIERAGYSATGSSLEVMGMSHLFVEFPELSVPYVYTGTSCASPALAGCLALIEQKEGDLTKDKVREMFTRYCVDMHTAGRDSMTGWGMFRMPPVEGGTVDMKTIVLTIDSRVATVNGLPVHIDAAPVIMNQRAMLPISFIVKELKGMRLNDIVWDGLKRTVTITGE